LGDDTKIEASKNSIRFFSFESEQLPNVNATSTDDVISENFSFQYPVFLREKTAKHRSAILLLHGLNERSWSKYLPWAEYLCNKTGKPVILFPIAYHMNRSPLWWCNPRETKQILELRKQRNGDDRSLSFANVAFSERISEKPYRFYSSGRQSFLDVVRLLETIKQGRHPLFEEDAQIDFFSYSIGAFLSQIIFMTNPGNLLSASKLFMFCGGSIFSAMSGASRSIMDKKAFDILFNYYISRFEEEEKGVSTKDALYRSFCSMISPDRNRKDRLSFFKDLGNRIAGISLKNDLVIPYEGVKEALGAESAGERIKLFDFDFPYTHENPFPVNGGLNQDLVSVSFNRVFDEAARFLA
jgi:hypothetical protein